jgi:hypothetical protein
MKPEHRYMAAFVAASLKAGRTFTHVYDHDAKREIPVGGVVRADAVDVFDGASKAIVRGAPEALYHHGSESYLRVTMEEAGFSGYDHASEQHFKGVFSGPLPASAVQLYDYETGRYHDFHVS